jgi:hypothetical protein
MRAAARDERATTSQVVEETRVAPVARPLDRLNSLISGKVIKGFAPGKKICA